MIVFVTQIYIEPGCDYPFTHIFQQFLSQEITRRVEMSTSFAQQFGPDFKLIFRMSAKPALEAPEIKGPTVFKKDKDVEFTIFLPFESRQDYSKVLTLLIDTIVVVLQRFQIETNNLERDSAMIIKAILSDVKMMRAPNA